MQVSILRKDYTLKPKPLQEGRARGASWSHIKQYALVSPYLEAYTLKPKPPPFFTGRQEPAVPLRLMHEAPRFWGRRRGCGHLLRRTPVLNPKP